MAVGRTSMALSQTDRNEEISQAHSSVFNAVVPWVAADGVRDYPTDTWACCGCGFG